MDVASPTAEPPLGGNQTDEATNKTNIRKKRRRNFTQDDRAQHRILEKQRREAFNDRMLVSTLPTMYYPRTPRRVAANNKIPLRNWLDSSPELLLIGSFQSMLSSMRVLGN